MAEFARQLYGENYYYEIVLKEDAMIKEVLRDKTKWLNYKNVVLIFHYPSLFYSG
jgi:hypothetical protein